MLFYCSFLYGCQLNWVLARYSGNVASLWNIMAQCWTNVVLGTVKRNCVNIKQHLNQINNKSSRLDALNITVFFHVLFFVC